MKQTLQAALIQYATESGLIEDHEGNPEEITIVTNDTVTELETEIEDLAEKITDSNRELDQVIEGSDAIIATDSKIQGHVEVLSNEAFAKRYDRVTQSYLWANVVESLEAVSFPAELFVDMESISFEADEPQEQAKADAGKLKQMATRFWKMLVAAAKAAKNFFIRLLDLFRNNAEKNARSLAILKATVESRDGAKAKKEKISTSSYRDLTVNGEINVISAMTMIGQGYTKHLAPAQAKVSKTLATTIEMVKKGEKVAESAEVQGKTSGQLLAEMMESFPDAFSFKLPGSRTAAFSITKKSAGQVSIGFDISKPVEEAPKEIAAPSLETAKAVIASLEAMAELHAGMNKSIDENVKQTEEMLAAAEKASGETIKDEAHKAALTAFVSAAQGILNNSKIFLPKYNAYALQASHTAYKFGMAVATNYPKKGEAKSEEKKEEKAEEAKA